MQSLHLFADQGEVKKLSFLTIQILLKSEMLSHFLPVDVTAKLIYSYLRTDSRRFLVNNDFPTCFPAGERAEWNLPHDQSTIPEQWRGPWKCCKNKVGCFSFHRYTKLKLQVTPEGRIPLKKWVLFPFLTMRSLLTLGCEYTFGMSMGPLCLEEE